jgi:hypothetical protein
MCHVSTIRRRFLDVIDRDVPKRRLRALDLQADLLFERLQNRRRIDRRRRNANRAEPLWEPCVASTRVTISSLSGSNAPARTVFVVACFACR